MEHFLPYLPMLIIMVGLPMVGGIVYAMTNPGRERKKRLEVAELALRRDDLTPTERQALVQVLAAPERPRSWPLFALGWLGMCGGVAWLLMDPPGDEFTVAATLTAVSFGFATLPFAYRELQRRHA